MVGMKAHIVRVEVDRHWFEKCWQHGHLQKEALVLMGVPEGAELRKVELADDLDRVVFCFYVHGERSGDALLPVHERLLYFRAIDRREECRLAWEAAADAASHSDADDFDAWWDERQKDLMDSLQSPCKY